MPRWMHREYFVRWMLHPQRIIPGTRMARFAPDGRSPVADVFDGDGARQFAAIYDFLTQRADQR